MAYLLLLLQALTIEFTNERRVMLFAERAVSPTLY